MISATITNDTGTSASDHITSDNTVLLTGSAEANSTVTISDGVTVLGTAAANGTGAWSYTTAALLDGAHSLTAKATDTAGNVGAASSALSVTIDTAAPAAPVISTFSPDTNIPGDNITTVSTLTLSGTAEANSGVAVYENALLLGTGSADGSGAWSFITAALADGLHILSAKAIDAAGNTSVASTSLSVTVVTIGPAAPVINSLFTADSNVVGDHITNSNALTLIGTAVPNSDSRCL